MFDWIWIGCSYWRTRRSGERIFFKGFRISFCSLKKEIQLSKKEFPLPFTVSLIDSDWVVRSSSTDVELFRLFICHELFNCWSWMLERNASEMLSEEISLPLPESGELLTKSCWFDVPVVGFEVENSFGRRNRFVGRDWRPYEEKKSKCELFKIRSACRDHTFNTSNGLWLLLFNFNSNSFV